MTADVVPSSQTMLPAPVHCSHTRLLFQLCAIFNMALQCHMQVHCVESFAFIKCPSFVFHMYFVRGKLEGGKYL